MNLLKQTNRSTKGFHLTGLVLDPNQRARPNETTPIVLRIFPLSSVCHHFRPRKRKIFQRLPRYNYPGENPIHLPWGGNARGGRFGTFATGLFRHRNWLKNSHYGGCEMRQHTLRESLSQKKSYFGVPRWIWSTRAHDPVQLLNLPKRKQLGPLFVICGGTGLPRKHQAGRATEDTPGLFRLLNVSQSV